MSNREIVAVYAIKLNTPLPAKHDRLDELNCVKVRIQYKMDANPRGYYASVDPFHVEKTGNFTMYGTSFETMMKAPRDLLLLEANRFSTKALNALSINDGRVVKMIKEVEKIFDLEVLENSLGLYQRYALE